MRSPHTLARAGRALVVGAALAAGGARAAAPAGGDDAESWLEWSRGAGAGSCGGRAEFSAALAAQLGEPPAAAARRWRRRVTVRLEHPSTPAASWSADLRLLADDGQIAGSRHIQRGDRSCAPLVDALTLVAALLLSAPAPVVAAAPTAAPASTAASPAAARRRTSRVAGDGDELRLLARARRALAHDPRLALSLAREHERRFPASAMDQERDVIAVAALADLGDGAEARQRAERFAREHPGSAYLERVRASAAQAEPRRR
jgi:hypothetical protein